MNTKMMSVAGVVGEIWAALLQKELDLGKYFGFLWRSKGGREMGLR